MEDRILEMCKKTLKIQNDFSEVECIYEGACKNCPFAFENNGGKESCTSLNKDEAIELAQNYIKEHEKTVNTINSIEEQTITLDDLKDIKENNIVPKYYNKGNIDTIQFCLEHDLPFCIGNIIKYIVRYKDKNGLEDLKKAREYLERTMNYTLKYNCEIWEYIVCFCRENNLDYVQGKIIEFLMEKRIEEALSLINNLIIWEEKKVSDINE